MSTFFYLCMTPESLVASMLPPQEFGCYLATGTKKSAHGQAMYFDLDPEKIGDAIDLRPAVERCVPHPDGHVKHSLYLAVYRVLERLPLEAIRNLWLATAKGQVLEVKPADGLPVYADNYFLYQEVCPVHPLVVSSLSPAKFMCFITDHTKPLFVPRLCFVDLQMGDLAISPDRANPANVFYPDYFFHLKECLLELTRHPKKHTKTVDRGHPEVFPYHFIKHGFYVGDRQRLIHYPFPAREELEGKYYYWWRRSAQH